MEQRITINEVEPREETLFVRQLQDAGFSAEQIGVILTLIEHICTDCWDNGRSCQCWNDC